MLLELAALKLRLFKAIIVILFTGGLIFIMIGCSTLTTQTIEKEKTGIEISKVGLTKKTINIGQGDSTEIKFNTSYRANVEVIIYNEEHSPIKEIKMANLDLGEHKIKWNGRNNKEQLVSNGVYTYTIKAKTEDGDTYLYDASDSTGGRVIKIEKFNLNPKNGNTSYLLPLAGRIRIRIGLKEGGPLLKTLLDWAPRAAGVQIEQWDGKDNSGEMTLFNHPDLFIIVHAYSLANNTIIVTGSRKAEYTGEEYYRSVRKDKHLHAMHSRSICHEPEIDMEFPDKNEMPVLHGTASIIIKISPTDTAHLTNSRYEIVAFIDNVFLFEDEEGYSPFTYLLDTNNIPDGEHFITINVVSYDDHIGIITKRVLIENRGKL